MEVSDFTFNAKSLLMGEFNPQAVLALSLHNTEYLKSSFQSQTRFDQQTFVAAVECSAQNSRSPDSIGHREINRNPFIFPTFIVFFDSRHTPPHHARFSVLAPFVDPRDEGSTISSQLTPINRRSQAPLWERSKRSFLFQNLLTESAVF